MPSWRGAQLKKAQGHLNLYLYLYLYLYIGQRRNILCHRNKIAVKIKKTYLIFFEVMYRFGAFIAHEFAFTCTGCQCIIKQSYLLLLLSFLGSTAQLRPWPLPQNPAEFLGGFSTIFFLQGSVVSTTPMNLIYY
jgi:hypothetical protein